MCNLKIRFMKHIDRIKRTANYLLGTVIILFITVSCSTQNSPSGYVMKFKADGTAIEFTGQSTVVAAFANSGSQYTATFTGYNSGSNISLTVYDNKAIAPGTFTGYTEDNSAFIGALIVYMDSNGKVYSQMTSNSDIKVVISQITATAVKGTFSGTLSSSDDSSISITNGEFYVWRVN